jgi:hypothetical protein
MKKVLLFFVAAAFLTSCGVDKKDPKAVTEAFVMAFANQEWDKAKEFSTKESAEVIDGIKGMMAMAPKDEKAEEVKIKNIECKEDGDKCNCQVEFETGAEKLGSSYDLVKVDGNWLVDFKKDTGMDDMDMDMDMDAEFGAEEEYIYSEEGETMDTEEVVSP